MIEKILNYFGYVKKTKQTNNLVITRNSLQPVVITHRMQLTRDQMMEDYDPQCTIDRINFDIANELFKQAKNFIVTKSWEDMNGNNQIESHLTILKEK
jgi:hypothetical protein